MPVCFWLSVFVFVCFSLPVPISISACLSTYLSTCMSICLPVPTSVCSFISVYLHLCLSIYLTVCFYLRLFVSVSISISISVCQSTYLSTCLYVYMSVRLPLSLFLNSFVFCLCTTSLLLFPCHRFKFLSLCMTFSLSFSVSVHWSPSGSVDLSLYHCINSSFEI